LNLRQTDVMPIQRRLQPQHGHALLQGYIEAAHCVT
jgi:hypothetical protein